MTRRVLTSLWLAGAMALAPAHASAAACWSSNEIASGQVRELQTKLMVAALQCRHHDGSQILSNYNIFVNRFKPALGEHNSVLRKRFERLHGKRAGQCEFDRYTTSLANSYGGNTIAPNYCAEMEAFASSVAAMSEEELVNVATQAVPLPTNEQQCGG